MPTYYFKCHCGHRVDLHRSVDARKLPVTCQTCGRDMEIQITAPGAILFKGRGFHANDYPRVR